MANSFWQGLVDAPNGGGGVCSAEAQASSVAVSFVDLAIIRAYELGASDVHFETNRDGMGVKYRLDGVMAPGERLQDSKRSEEVISRIKVMAQLDITERRRPQDGRIHWSRAGHDTIDLRVSIMPSIFGEDAVLRLLDKAQLREAQISMSLDVLGFDPEVGDTIRALAARPHGMLLITGPTGSGKTTTVYAALSEVNNGLEKIITIEDPVEYELPGVLQIPVNEQKGLTFATGLRSILRHDPDKILVGEIRDSETAEIAVQSSLTGHLVLTTVHANSLFDVLGRFRHFDIDPFSLASALNGVAVQRLLRKVCPHCAQSRMPTASEGGKLAALQLPVPARLPMAMGCAHCRHTGYRGRFVVAEVHDFDDKARDLMVRGASMSELKAFLYQDPANRLLRRALAKVERGTTTLEEVVRVVGLA
jgi:general secretion pathway protein E